MELSTFEKSISGAILERGKNYFNHGAVSDLENEGDGRWTATVEGTDTYEVAVEVDEEGIIVDYSCDCPFDGGMCKHVVAVLFCVREQNKDTKKAESKKTDIEQVILSVPEDKLRAFVLAQARKNDDLRNLLLVEFAAPESVSNRRNYYKKVVDTIISNASDRHGYVSYRDVFDLTSEIDDILARARDYIREKKFHEAFAIASVVAPAMIKLLESADDSSGSCGATIDETFEVVASIMESEIEKNMKDEIFAWILEQNNNTMYSDYGCDDTLERLLFTAQGTTEKESKVIDFFDQQYQKAKLKEGFSGDYGMKNALMQKAAFLRQCGKPEQADAIVTEHIYIPEFRKQIVINLLSGNNNAEAIVLIKEGIAIAEAKNNAGTVREWKEMLLSIYQSEGETTQVRELSLDMYKDSRYNMKHYRDYKSTFSPEEWAKELPKIILLHAKKDINHRVFVNFPYDEAAIYVEEQMWPKLFGLIKRHNSADALRKYVSYLAKDYSRELLPLYQDAILKLATRASDRKAYAELANWITEMAKLDGGSVMAANLKATLLQNYRNKPALKDELRNC